ncbi:SinI family restriction endonuclease [Ancylomarina euxinus]|uniref:SinI family restriction endonuclease n=2 Tax=Ancylomarina euxinus TaxID=2283627 RepID=A0A425Y8P4_9BACT|nr:SinI family restriction endonuclease [Ancylomarina euxinus]RRG24870.1 SinI family restriction endonuclease [Ancylomarina euxinus]
MSSHETWSDYIAKWTTKYINGYQNRCSERVSNPIGTKHDNILDDIIISSISKLTSSEIEQIKFAHRLSMSAENIGGALLEEYLSEELIQYKWHCCWGETLKSIDFCNENGKLLQIKNSDNSENSSSQAVRNGTAIMKWFRRHAKKGTTNWDALNTLLNITDLNKTLSEAKYKAFVKRVLVSNPDALFIEGDNVWQ